MEHEIKLKRWKGKLHTGEYLTWNEMAEWEKAVDKARQLGDNSSVSEFYSALLPIALKIIHKTEIKGLPEALTLETFPASPHLCAEVVKVIARLYELTSGDEELPKAPEPS